MGIVKMTARLGFKDVFIHQVCCCGTATLKPWKNEEKFWLPSPLQICITQTEEPWCLSREHMKRILNCRSSLISVCKSTSTGCEDVLLTEVLL